MARKWEFHQCGYVGYLSQPFGADQLSEYVGSVGIKVGWIFL
jgi:hypothetical protein